MKKNLLFLVTIAALELTRGHSQTNISGGIFANTTWTLANSPYIVTGNVVVFPGFKLTIQPGVVVKFDAGMQLEIRQASLLAMGTATDSITFTSNTTHGAGAWNQIYLNGGNLTSKFDYCNFTYSNFGINSANTLSDSLIVSHSSFNHNNTGLKFYPVTTWSQNGNLKVNSCIFKSNTNFGLDVHYVYIMAIDSCNFMNNGTGFQGGGYSGTCHIKNCNLYQNQTGMNNIIYMLVDKCSITNNQTGISSGSENIIINCTIDSNSTVGVIAIGDSVANCRVWHNGVGVQSPSSSFIVGNDIEYNVTSNIVGGAYVIGNIIRNSVIGINNTTLASANITRNLIQNNNIGININYSFTIINCNVICNNTTYDLKYGASSNLNAAHNYWCTPDSITTEVAIYDGHDNISYGLVTIMPIDSSCVPLTLGISKNEVPDFSFKIFPNPTFDHLTIEFSAAVCKAEIKIINVIGGVEYSLKTGAQKTDIDVSTLGEGLHIIQITHGNNISRQQFIKQ